MKSMTRILFATACVALLGISWVIAVTARTDREKQAELVRQAQTYLDDRIYVRAVPLLEEAAGYSTDDTFAAEEILKDAYRQLMETDGYPRKYINLLEKQMRRSDAPEQVFAEAAEYWLAQGKKQEALKIWNTGAKRTGSRALEDLYEGNRYDFLLRRDRFEDVTEFLNGTIQVKRDGLWGLAARDGSLAIPCEYERLSTYSDGQCAVFAGGVLSAVDINNNRVALCHEAVKDFTNYQDSRLWILEPDRGWHLSDSDFYTGSVYVEDAGMYSDGVAPVLKNGKWGLVKRNGSDWLLDAEYDDIIRDELGRAYQDGRVFVRQGGTVNLLAWDAKAKGFVQTVGSWEDARPFNGGWAAVKKDGKWGFIDRDGTVMIDFRFDDARSFGQHLAAVELDGTWGYVSLRGEIVIEPQFFAAKSFNSGSAPVLTENGWQMITLVEYEEAGGL